MTIECKEVAPDQIEHTLNTIWEALETKQINRACLFNLIFYTEQNSRLPYIQRLAQKIIEKFPARIIFVTVDKNRQEEMLKTGVCILSASQGQYDIACDYIYIHTSSSLEERVPFLLLPHLLSDLPIYLLWGENPKQDSILCNYLQTIVDRIIFDSETTDNLSQFASTLLNYKCDIADLNWARIEDWKEMLKIAFHSEEHLAQLRQAKLMTIVYNAHPSPTFCHTNLQAIYLQAWLSTQLGFKFKQSNQNGFEYDRLKVLLQPEQDPSLPPGLILSLQIVTESGWKYDFKRSSSQINQITFTYTTPEKCSMPCYYLFAKAESGHSLVKEVCHRGTSESFLNVLKLIKTAEIHAC